MFQDAEHFCFDETLLFIESVCDEINLQLNKLIETMLKISNDFLVFLVTLCYVTLHSFWTEKAKIFDALFAANYPLAGDVLLH